MQKAANSRLDAPQIADFSHSSSTLWRQTTVTRNAQDQEEAFSIGPDGQVWSFMTEAGKLGRTALTSLNMPADFLAVGQNAHGALVVITIKGLSMHFRTETPMGPERWSEAAVAPLPAIAHATGVRRLYIQTDFTGMRIAMIVDTNAPGSTQSYVMACSQWLVDGPGPFVLVPPITAAAPKPITKPVPQPLFRKSWTGALQFASHA